MKARSRLKSGESNGPRISKSQSQTTLVAPSHNLPTKPSPNNYRPHHKNLDQLQLQKLASLYTSHLGTLFLGIVFGFLTTSLMRSIKPDIIANLVLPHSYLPFQVGLFSTIFFLSSFLWLNTRRGYLTALTVQSLVFLQLQKVEVTWQLSLSLMTLFVIIELTFIYLARNSHAIFKQNPQTRYRRTRS